MRKWSCGYSQEKSQEFYVPMTRKLREVGVTVRARGSPVITEANNWWSHSVDLKVLHWHTQGFLLGLVTPFGLLRLFFSSTSEC